MPENCNAVSTKQMGPQDERGGIGPYLKIHPQGVQRRAAGGVQNRHYTFRFVFITLIVQCFIHKHCT